MMVTLILLSLLETEGEGTESFYWFSFAMSGSKRLVAAVPRDCRVTIVPLIIDLILFLLEFIAETAFYWLFGLKMSSWSTALLG